MNRTFLKSLAVVSSLSFAVGFIAYRAGAFDGFLREELPQVPIHNEAGGQPETLGGSKSYPLGTKISPPASAAKLPGPKAMAPVFEGYKPPPVILPGSKSAEVPRPVDQKGLAPQP